MNRMLAGLVLAALALWPAPASPQQVAGSPQASANGSLTRLAALAAEGLPEPVAPEVRGRIRERIVSLAQAIDALIVSDYDYGSVDPDLGRLCAELSLRPAQARGFARFSARNRSPQDPAR